MTQVRELEVSVGSLFHRSKRRRWLIIGVAWTLFLAATCAGFVVLLSTDAATLTILGIPALIAVPWAAGIALVVALVSVPFWYPIERRQARALAAPVYRVGSTPWSRSVLVIDESALRLIDRDGRTTAQWKADDVDVVILESANNAVTLVIADQDRFYELSLTLRVKGPVAPAWSYGGIIGRRALEEAVRRDLLADGYAIADAPVEMAGSINPEAG